jgi:hypothetical protein
MSLIPVARVNSQVDRERPWHKWARVIRIALPFIAKRAPCLPGSILAAGAGRLPRLRAEGKTTLVGWEMDGRPAMMVGVAAAGAPLLRQCDRWLVGAAGCYRTRPRGSYWIRVHAVEEKEAARARGRNHGRARLPTLLLRLVSIV